jgi:hypothetical protein
MMENKKDGKKIPYEPPKAVRLVDTKEGRGACINTGSGDTVGCTSGNVPGGFCAIGSGD